MEHKHCAQMTADTTEQTTSLKKRFVMQHKPCAKMTADTTEQKTSSLAKT